MKKILIYSLLFLFSPWMLFAQVANQTALVGTVTDQSGSVVPNAKVTGTNVDTKVDYTGTTNAEGYYSIPYVSPGTYNITVEDPGFSRIITTGVIVTINLSVRTDAVLKIGSTASEVSVTASTPALSTDDALLGRDRRQYADSRSPRTRADRPLRLPQQPRTLWSPAGPG